MPTPPLSTPPPGPTRAIASELAVDMAVDLAFDLAVDLAVDLAIDSYLAVDMYLAIDLAMESRIMNQERLEEELTKDVLFWSSALQPRDSYEPSARHAPWA
ncbi:MAG: hypothetical protein ACK5RA_15425 [Cyanobacteriota bacterium]